MKQILQLSVSIFLLWGIGFFSCQKEDQIISKNKPPIANAGIDQTVLLPKDSALLDGSNSGDPDGTISKYQWTKIAGPASFTIVNSTSSTTMVRSLTAGVYQFELRVYDNRNAYSKDTVQVLVSTGNGINHPPVAMAGTDQLFPNPVSSCTLNGSGSFDPDGTISSYQWSRISGPAGATIVNPGSAQTPVNNMTGGVYEFELTVTDNLGLSDKDTVQVSIYAEINCNVNNRPQITVVLNQVGTLSVPRSPSVASAAGKVVFAGGMSSSGFSGAVDIFDVKTNTWVTAQLSEPRWLMAAVSIGNKIFFAGGGNASDISDNVDIYDAVKEEWTVAQLSEPRARLVAAVVGSKVLFAGGLSGGFWEQSQSVDIYDTLTKQWSTSSLYEAKYAFGAVTVGNKVYFAGGWDWLNSNAAMNSIDIYNNDNPNNPWSRSNLHELSGGVSGVAVGDYIYWAGISTQQNKGVVEIWNTTNNTYTLGCLSYPRNYPTAVVRNNEIAFFTPGTHFLNEAFSNQIDIYNTSSGQWSIGLLNQTNAAAGVISVDNAVYMGGGLLSTGNYTDKVYMLSW